VCMCMGGCVHGLVCGRLYMYACVCVCDHVYVCGRLLVCVSVYASDSVCFMCVYVYYGTLLKYFCAHMTQVHGRPSRFGRTGVCGCPQCRVQEGTAAARVQKCACDCVWRQLCVARIVEVMG